MPPIQIFLGIPILNENNKFYWRGGFLNDSRLRNVQKVFNGLKFFCIRMKPYDFRRGAGEGG
jgi:hypothetical protein